MADRINREHRSWNMSRIKGRDTTPERAVRSILHRMGYRFRLHGTDLPGKPDIVLPRYKTVVLVHGCFWHRHRGCKYTYTPKSRITFWQKKFEENIRRDRKVRGKLKKLGWRVVIVWECEINNMEKLQNRLKSKLIVERI